MMTEILGNGVRTIIIVSRGVTPDRLQLTGQIRRLLPVPYSRRTPTRYPPKHGRLQMIARGWWVYQV